MKVRISQRVVYHKVAEVEIDIPNDIHEDDIQEYINNHEELWTEDIDKKLSEAEYRHGLGMHTGDWSEKEDVWEWRYDVDEIKYGGHL